MQTLIALFVLAQQLQGVPAYTLPVALDPPYILVTQRGRFSLDMGVGCDGLVGQNVLVYPGSGGVASLGPADGSDPICNVFVGPQISDTPCLELDGTCEVGLEPSSGG